jgi:hypothetical protein
VTDQFYFLTLAGLGLSVAGSAGLVTALRGDGRWSRADLWRLRNIIGTSLMFVFVALLPVPIFRAVGGREVDDFDHERRRRADLHERCHSCLPRGSGMARLRETGRHHSCSTNRAHALNVFVGSIALLMFGLLSVLLYPVQLFIRVIRDFQPPTKE